MTDHYLLLGLSFDYEDEATLRKTYRRAALVAHPDRNNGSSALFLQLKSALETLSNERRSYDRETFSTLLVPASLGAVLEERGQELDVVVVTWDKVPAERARYILRIRSEGQLCWNTVFEGAKRRVAVQGLGAGWYEFAVSVQPGGPPRVTSCQVPDRAKERVQQVMQLTGFNEEQAVKAMARHGSVQAVLDNLMQTGTRKKRVKKKKTKKKKQKEQVAHEAAAAAASTATDNSEATVNEQFLLANVKCSRCKVFIALEMVESHICDPALVRFGHAE